MLLLLRPWIFNLFETINRTLSFRLTSPEKQKNETKTSPKNKKQKWMFFFHPQSQQWFIKQLLMTVNQLLVIFTSNFQVCDSFFLLSFEYFFNRTNNTTHRNSREIDIFMPGARRQPPLALPQVLAVHQAQVSPLHQARPPAVDLGPLPVAGAHQDRRDQVRRLRLRAARCPAWKRALGVHSQRRCRDPRSRLSFCRFFFKFFFEFFFVFSRVTHDIFSSLFAKFVQWKQAL